MARQSAIVSVRVGSADNPDASRLFVANSKVDFSLDPGGYGYAVMLDLNAHGTVQAMWPIPTLGDPSDGAVGSRVSFTAPVTEPFGADYVISIVSREPLGELANAILSLHNSPAPEALFQAFRSDVADTDIRIGINAYYSCAQNSGDQKCK